MNTFYENRFVGVWSKTYLQKLAFKIAISLLIIGGLNWLLMGLFNVNIVSGIFGKSIFTTFIYVLVGVSALAIMFDRDTYLPFLGPMVVPCSVLEIRDPPGATREVKINVEPNVKIIYWAAEPSSGEKLNSWKNAYLDYQNAGVTLSNGSGEAVLKIREPQSYKVPFKGKLAPHVHYRVCGSEANAGWMGKINTVMLNKNTVEGFAKGDLRFEHNKTHKSYKVVNLADTSASIY
jgi:uncharacterized membrane protein YuzA (DUF378 family)